MASVADIEDVASPFGPSTSEGVDQASHRLLSAEFLNDRDRIGGDRLQNLHACTMCCGVHDRIACLDFRLQAKIERVDQSLVEGEVLLQPVDLRALDVHDPIKASKRAKFRSYGNLSNEQPHYGTTRASARFLLDVASEESGRMKTMGIAYAGTLISFLLIDAIWLGLVARNFYQRQLGDMMLPSPNFSVAAIFYVFFAVAIVVLAVRPGLEAGSIWTAVGYAAVLGLAAYGTYDMTNLSTLKNWPVPMTIVDLIWGTVLTSVASACGYAAVRYFG